MERSIRLRLGYLDNLLNLASVPVWYALPLAFKPQASRLTFQDGILFSVVLFPTRELSVGQPRYAQDPSSPYVRGLILILCEIF
jgi:hypothetical protein